MRKDLYEIIVYTMFLFFGLSVLVWLMGGPNMILEIAVVCGIGATLLIAKQLITGPPHE